MRDLSNWTFNFFRNKLETIERLLVEIKNKENRIMSQMDDLSAQMDVLEADEKALVEAQNKAFADLEAAVKAGGSGPDLAPFISRLQANHIAMVQALADAQAADATTAPPPPPAA